MYKLFSDIFQQTVRLVECYISSFLCIQSTKITSAHQWMYLSLLIHLFYLFFLHVHFRFIIPYIPKLCHSDFVRFSGYLFYEGVRTKNNYWAAHLQFTFFYIFLIEFYPYSYKNWHCCSETLFVVYVLFSLFFLFKLCSLFLTCSFWTCETWISGKWKIKNMYQWWK